MLPSSKVNYRLLNKYYSVLLAVKLSVFSAIKELCFRLHKDSGEISLLVNVASLVYEVISNVIILTLNFFYLTITLLRLSFQVFTPAGIFLYIT